MGVQTQGLAKCCRARSVLILNRCSDDLRRKDHPAGYVSDSPGVAIVPIVLEGYDPRTNLPSECEEPTQTAPAMGML